MKNKVVFGIRTKFFFAFFLSLSLGFITFFIFNGIARNNSTDYSSEIKEFNSQFESAVKDIKINLNNEKQLNRIINKCIYNNTSLETFLVDKYGNVLMKPSNTFIGKFNINELSKFKSTSNFLTNKIKYSRVEKINEDNYVVVTCTLIKSDQFKLVFLAIPVFILSFFILTYGKIKYIKALTNSLKVIANGDLDVKVPIKGKDEISVLAENINQMTYELKSNKEKEKEVEKAKDELIVNVSHDLRTPLTSIIGYVKLLKEKYRIDEDFEKHLGIIDNKLERLDSLINDLFEYSKLTSRGVEINKSKVLFNELIRQVIEELIPFGLQNNVEVKFNSLYQNELFVDIDPSKMARAFENVISNAIKYSRKPGIVEVKTYKEENKVISCIYNKGSKLKSEEISKIFDRFYRTDVARNSDTGGSGIGLSIAESIVKLHNGEIWAESNDEGVCFYIALNCI